MRCLRLALWLAVAAVVVTSLEHLSDEVDLSTAIDAFQDWFSAGYGPELGVRLGPAGEGMRMGVFAIKNFSAESPYLSIPLHLIIDEATIFPTPIVGPMMQRLQPHLRGRWNAQLTLGLFLLHQRFVDPTTSKWKAYIDLLPTAHDSPAFYTADELALLRGMPVVDAARHVHSEMSEVYHVARRAVAAVPGADDVFPSWAFNEVNWRWVQGILNSRMIWWDNGPHLVPMLDMINCRQGPRGRERRVHSTTRVGSKAVTYAPWAFVAGDQVFENYGQPNPTYFLYHGFTMTPNVHDCAKLMWIATKKKGGVAPLQEARRSLAQRLGIWDHEYCISTTQTDRFLATARVMTTSTTFHHADDVLRPLVNGSEERRALLHAVRAIREQRSAWLPSPWSDCLTAAGEHPSTAASACRKTWLESSRFTELPFRHRMAILFRESQRDLLVQVERHLQKLRKAIPKASREKAAEGPQSTPANGDL